LDAVPIATPQACPEQAKRVKWIPPLVRFALSVGKDPGARSRLMIGNAKKLSFRAKPKAESRNLWAACPGWTVGSSI